MLVLCTTAREDSDVTPEFRKWHESQGVDQILVKTGALPRNQAKDMTALQLEALGLGADWVINADTDEFWVADGGTLQDFFLALPRELGWLLAPEVEFLPDGKRSYLDHKGWMGLGLNPKTAHRPGPGARVLFGNAGIHGVHGKVRVLHHLTVLHWPLRDPEQAKRKCSPLAATFPLDPRPVARLLLYRAMVQDPEQMMATLGHIPSVEDGRLSQVLEAVS